ncbi:MAG: flagellar hook-associated protein FlgL [Thermodesulfobacteriota bacterium]
MRVTHAASFRLMETEINQINKNMGKLQEQAATGKRVNQLSDDPAAIRPILNFRTQIDATDRYEQNMGSAQVGLKAVEGKMDRAQELLVQLEEHTIQAINGGYLDSDEENVANIVSQLKDEMVGIANTKMNGKYMFAGFKDQLQPFVGDGDGGIAYEGDSNRRSLEVAPGEKVDVTMDGASFFMGQKDSDGNGDLEQTGTNIFELFASIEDSMRKDEDTVVSQKSFEEKKSVMIPDGDNETLTINGETFDIIEDDTTLKDLVDDINDTFDDDVEANAVKNSQGRYELHITPKAGEEVNIQSEGVFEGFVGELQSHLEEIQSAMDQVSNRRGDVGITINRLESAVDSRKEASKDLQEFLSVYEDADIIEVSTDLMQQQTSLKAALSVTSQIGRMTLLDYM